MIQKKYRDPYEVFLTVLFFQNLTSHVLCVISGYCLAVAEKYALLGCYAASGGKVYDRRFKTTCRSHPRSSRMQKSKRFSNRKNGTDRMFRTVAKKLTLLDA